MQKTWTIFGRTKRPFTCFSKKCSTKPRNVEIQNIRHCAELVRKLDHDNFLSSLLLPPKVRRAAFAIRALNVELSKIQEQTNEHQTGIMRLKFWENSLDSIYDDSKQDHPVLTEVQKAVQKYNLSKLLFKRLLNARVKQLNVSTFKDMEDMENYADHTCATVLMLLLEAMNVKDIDCDHVASHVGRAQGLTNLIRSLPYNLKENIVLLPRTELLEHNVSEESLKRNSVDPNTLADIIFKIASKAHSHLNVAESLKSKTPISCRTIFLPAVPVRVFLKKLQKAKFNIYEPSLSSKNALLPYSLLWKKIFMSF